MKPNLCEEGQSGESPVRPVSPPKSASGFRVAFALLALSAVPIAAGAVRLAELAGGAELTPANERFFASPMPVTLHILSSSVYALLGAFQFASGFRRRSPGWHRSIGWLLIPSGLVSGLSGLWMTLFYHHPDSPSAWLFLFRLLFGSAMVASIVLGVAAIRRGDVGRHRAWMTRGYAIGLGAGTQVLTQLAGALLLGQPSKFSEALLMGAGWSINLIVAEWAIRRQRGASG